MLKIFLPLVLCFSWAFQVLAQTTSVTDRDPAAPIVTMNSDGTPFELYVEPNSGSTTSPHQVFVPIASRQASGSDVDNINFSFYAGRADLPGFVGEQTKDVADGSTDITVSLIFRLNVDADVGSGLDQLAVAVGTGSSFEVVQVNTVTGDSPDLSFVLNLETFCGVSSFDCSAFELSDDTSVSGKTNIYFFVTNNSTGIGDTVDPSSAGTGPIYEINLSNRVYQNNTMNLTSLFKGDTQLTLDFTGFTMTNDRGLYALVTNAGSGLCSGASDEDTNDTLGGLGKSFSDLTDLESRVITGQVKLEGLENGVCQRVRILNCDLYGFCSFASQELQNTPESIQALLEKQACFFFTAGFGEQHPIVDYFQAWRDNTLKKTWLGRRFVEVYYSVAPQYTPFILERPWLQKLIRGVAYVLYGVIKGWPVLLFLLMLTVVQFRLRKKLI
jgi:hypothetical protein